MGIWSVDKTKKKAIYPVSSCLVPHKNLIIKKIVNKKNSGTDRSTKQKKKKEEKKQGYYIKIGKAGTNNGSTSLLKLFLDFFLVIINC